MCLAVFITLLSLLEINNTFAFLNFHPVISILIFVFTLISVLSVSTTLIKKIISIKREKSNKERKKKSLASFITNLVIGIIFSILAF